MILAAMMAGWLAASASAAEVMPAARENALVQKYCTVCHTDAANNGGLSLEHFDAAVAAPSLAAMMLSKLTGGVALEKIREVPSNASAAAYVNNRTSSGAMSAAGIPKPDKATIAALVHALATQANGATSWTVQPANAAAANAPVLTASLLREMPSPKNADEVRSYRLVVSCNAATHEGSMQVAWSPAPQRGTLAASVDGNVAVNFKVEGSEKMGNGSSVVTNGLAALMVDLPLPTENLTINDLFPGETVVFPFTNLPKDARLEFERCFSVRTAYR